ncbi:MAG TPA: Maf family protein [Thermoanaerobaculia bacterium]|nr:Maf family protein [Thermoanaerobaculia bacterium]
MPDARLLLASASPRRAEMLTALGIRFRVAPSGIPEDLLPGENAVAAARRLARTKALDAARSTDLPVLAADTLVFLEGTVFGKPADAADARRMLAALSGRSHSVVTAVALVAGGRVHERAGVSSVRFAPMTDAEIAWYASSGEPMDKAGAYAIQGAGARFIESIEGSPSNVIGLPARAVYELLREAGLDDLALPALPGNAR